MPSKNIIKLLGLRICVIFFTIFTSCTLSGASDSKRPSKPFLGAYLQPQQDLKDFGYEYAGKKGVRIRIVIDGSSANKAGLIADDVIIEYDSKNFDSLDTDSMAKTFRDYVSEQKKVNEVIRLKILRVTTSYSGNKNQTAIEGKLLYQQNIENILKDQKIDENIELFVRKKMEVLSIDAILEEKTNLLATEPPQNKDLFPEYDHYSDPYISAMRGLINDYDLNDDYKDSLKRYDDDEWWDDGFRLGLFRYIHRDPIKLPKFSSDMTESIQKAFCKNKLDSSRLIQTLATILDETDLKETSENDKLTFFNQAINYIRKALNYRNLAFEKLTQEEIAFLYDNLVPLTDAFAKDYFLDANSNQDEVYNHKKILKLAHKVNYQCLFKSALSLSPLVNPEFLNNLAIELKGLTPIAYTELSGVSGDVYMITETTIGKIIIGGPKTTKYSTSATLIIDLGGDDIYLKGAAAANNEKLPVSVLIDLAGDDQYSSTDPIDQGSGLLGTALLIDFAGNDNYRGIKLSQGCGIFGTGQLVDFSGDDQYYGNEYFQGVAFWGMGCLIDLKGNDIYNAALFAQGVGGTKALGLLMDTAGNDQYIATGKYKSSYETDGIYNGSSQGFGIGFRGIASGGVGILLDIEGNDRFTAGNFSQGGGYYFGLGVLKNCGNNDDIYLASRYGQGFSAHSALGVLIDEGGNDIYRGLEGAVQSAAWDLGAATLVDQAGNDIYDSRMNFFSLGASAHNGFSMFIDMSGNDLYLSDGRIQKPYANDYHDGSSFGFFIDSEGDDTYSKDKNNDRYHEGKHSIFVDDDIKP